MNWMKRKIRRLFMSIALGTMLVVLVSACGASDTGKSGSETDAGKSGPEQEAAGPVIEFETTDLDGNPVKSADLFAANRLTMVNIWGTFCGPCIGEMPDLEVLRGRLEEKGCGIVGVVCDVAGIRDTQQVESAKEILQETGVTYLNIIPWSGFNRELPAQFIPTTYFINSDGAVIGEAAIGARGADDYEALVDALLETLNQ